MHKISTRIIRFHSTGILLLLLVLTGCTDELVSPAVDEFDDPGREVMMPLSLEVEGIVTLGSASRSDSDDDWSPTPEDPDPRISEDETRLHDFWILQYNSAGNRVGMPYYQKYSGQGEKPVIPFLIPTKPGNKFTTVVVANTGDSTLFTDENSETVRKVKNVHKPMKNADDVWVIIDDKKHLPMSGKIDVDYNTLSISVHLRPNVAKLHLYFKLMKTTDGEGDAGGGNSWDRKRKTLAVNWGNVPDIPYADILYESDNYNDDEHRFPSPVNPANLNLFPITTDKEKLTEIIGYSLDMSDKPSTIDVYLPRNTQGVNQNTNPYLKSPLATEHALFLEIVCSDKEETQQNKYRRIEFMVGANDVNDYNIIPGKFYDIDFTFSNFPTDDGPVKKLYRRYGEGNAYIVNPNDPRIINRFPISPVNNYATELYPGAPDISKKTYTYWEEAYFKIYLQELKEVNNDVTGQLTQDPSTWERRREYFTTYTDSQHEPVWPFAITPDTEWVAEVIWQDSPKRLINFCDYLGMLTNNGDYYESAGAMWLPVKMADFNIFKQTFLIKGGTKDVLDPAAFKDPFNDRNPTRSEIFFKTTGAEGNVIVGIRKKSEDGKPVEDREYLWSWHLWITNYNPAELGQSTMDRNIGAMESGGVGFYYQFGRKDPFPHWKASVYDINGKELTQLRHTIASGESASMLIYRHPGKTTTKDIRETQTNAVKWPYKLFYHTAGTTATTLANKNYIGQTVGRTTAWPVSTSAANWNPQDPSPQGWVLPPDEKQPETPPGSWTMISSWDGLTIPAGGLRADPYRYTTLFDLYRGENPFLWVTGPHTVLPTSATNTGTYTAPYYSEGMKSMVDALPVRCTKR